MQIDMAPQGSKRGFRGMTMLQLARRRNAHHAGGNTRLRRRREAGAAPEGAPSLPIEIPCQRAVPFRFHDKMWPRSKTRST